MSPSPIDVVVLDPQGGKLAALLRGIGIELRVVESSRALEGQEPVSTLVLGFEVLEPDPQEALRELRRTVNPVRVVVLYAEDSPRARLAKRLWSAGACDFIVPSSAPPDAIRQTVRQAMADAFVEASMRAAGPSAEGEIELLRFLQRLAAAVATHGAAETILRELSMKLPNLLECRVLTVLVLEEPSPRLYVFQSEPVDYTVIWSLTVQACRSVEPFVSGPAPHPEKVEFVHGATLKSKTQSAGHGSTGITLPMVSAGEAVGAISVLLVQDAQAAQRDLVILQLIASQLATMLRQSQMLARLKELSSKDPITGLHNRRYLSEALDREWSRAHRYSLQLSVVAIDIDDFRGINELHGRFVGNAVLKSMAELLLRHVRSTDHLARADADRFVMLLPETGLQGATALVERVRVALKATPIEAEGVPIDVSVSAGIASHPMNAPSSGEVMLAMAEGALQQAKELGRNRTYTAGGTLAASTQADHIASIEQRRHVRMSLELPAMFVPLGDVDGAEALRVSSINVSASGLALRDPTQRLKTGGYGLVFFEDRSDPLLTQVAWIANRDGEHQAGLRCLRSSELVLGAEPRPPRGRTALVLAENPDHVTALKRALRSARYDLRLADPTAIVPDEMLRECSLVVIDTAFLASPAGKKILEARSSSPATKLVILNASMDREGAIEMISKHGLEHVISDGDRSAEFLFTTLTKLVKDDFFGVRRYLLPGVDTKSWTVLDPSEKSFVLSGVRSVAEEVDCHPRVIDLLISALDEMLINALYHPPASASSPADAMKPVTVECGSDGRLLCVSVLDEHGLLQLEDVYGSLNEPSSVRTGSHHGFRIMLSSLAQVAINIEPHRRCEIIGVIDLRQSLREHRSAAPSLGVFVPS
jgi:diguanylate cyclase (GGDEF)-like protein